MRIEQQNALDELVKANEELQAPRVIIDYAILLAVACDPTISNQELTDYVEKLYREKYPS